jgi:hypothetical protein
LLRKKNHTIEAAEFTSTRRLGFSFWSLRSELVSMTGVEKAFSDLSFTRQRNVSE